MIHTNLAILSPHNIGDGGTWAINLAAREALNFSDDKLTAGDVILITANNYRAWRSDGSGGDDDVEEIFNGERCNVEKVGVDFIDVVFPQNSEGITRRVRLITNDGKTAYGQLPDGTDLGYAMSTHKAQGSQFKTVIVLAERGSKIGGIVQRSSVYTAVSRAVDHVIILGAFSDCVHACNTDELRRDTLFPELLSNFPDLPDEGSQP